ATDVDEADVGDAMAEPVELRVATFNVALSDFEAVGDLAKALEAGSDKGRKVAEIIQRVRPDVLLINEFDRDTSGEALDRWRSDYLGVGQAGQEPIAYPHTYTPDCNTGRLADADLSGDGQIKLPEDGYGFGNYDGQYCMVLLSRYPIESASVRTWQNLLWRDLSGNMLPTDHYSESAQAVFRLSSKTHADVPVVIGETVLHMLISHPTPPVFDGPEDRNGRRNFDEIRLWADLLTPDPGEQLVDDAGNRGGLGAEALFVIAGDQNADPDKGDSVDGAIAQLLDHPRVNATTVPLGGNGSSETSSFGLRVDYVLPSSNLTVKGSGVFAPAADDPLAALATASDHRLVWVDLVVEPH
ncbi:MAG: endonuclease/exonuclease/phosphatase family protein, partial [Myxococcota bacterium]